MTKHRDTLRKHAEELLNKPGVYAVGLGEKISNGKRTGKKALICSIKQKKPVAQLTQEDFIPKDIDGIPTDIIEIGDRPRAFKDWREKQRPVVPGISCGHVEVTAGTIGAIVEINGEKMLLSNNHVIANENNAELGDVIIQPGSYDHGTLGDQIATLYNYVPLTFKDQTEPTPSPGEPPAPPPEPEPDPPLPPAPPAPPVEEDSDCAVAKIFTIVANKVADIFGRSTRLKAVRPSTQAVARTTTTSPQNITSQVILNRVDAALARFDSDIEVNANYLIYSTGVKGINELAGAGTKVHKLGRTTGHTEGIVSQTDVTVDVQYGDGVCRFEDQIMIKAENAAERFSGGGDSGSLIMDENDMAVALLFAGNDIVTFANPIFNVIEELGIDRFVDPEDDN